MQMELIIPSRNELCCITCDIKMLDMTESSLRYTNRDWTIMKCRLILILLPNNVIVGPCDGTNNFINIVTTRKFLATEKLQKWLKQLNILWKEAQPVTTKIYEACLNFTIKSKISFIWNQTMNCYTKLSTPPLESVEIQITVNGENAIMKLQISRLELLFVKLEHLGLTREEICKFRQNDNATIDIQRNSVLEWVYVLPSARMGKMLSVSKGSFKDYNQLRRYWMNLYGYQLPKTDADILYYKIKFYDQHPETLIYPNVCVLARPPQFSHSNNIVVTVESFLKDMIKIVPRLCDQPLNVLPMNRETAVHKKFNPPSQNLVHSIKSSAQESSQWKDSKLLTRIADIHDKNITY